MKNFTLFALLMSLSAVAVSSDNVADTVVNEVTNKVADKIADKVEGTVVNEVADKVADKIADKVEAAAAEVAPKAEVKTYYARLTESLSNAAASVKNTTVAGYNAVTTSASNGVNSLNAVLNKGNAALGTTCPVTQVTVALAAAAAGYVAYDYYYNNAADIKKAEKMIKKN